MPTFYTLPTWKPFAQKEFWWELVTTLCHDQCIRMSQHPTQQRPEQSLERLRGSHFPETSTVRRDCRVCSVHSPGGQRRLITTFCGTCGDHPHLCIGECFRKYHTTPHLQKKKGVYAHIYLLLSLSLSISFSSHTPPSLPILPSFCYHYLFTRFLVKVV